MSEAHEIIRHAVVRILAARHPAALTARAVRARVRTEVGEATADEVASALGVLEDKGLARWYWDDLGSTRWWAATAAGVLAAERA